MSDMKPRRGIATTADLRARSIVDPVTHCWNWQGAMSRGTPRIWTFDHELGNKAVMTGPRAVWNIAHGETPRRGWLVFRSCQNGACVNPAHHHQAQDRAAIGLHQRRAGSRKGKNTEQCRANISKAHAASGCAPTPTDVVLAIRAAPACVTGLQLAAAYGICNRTVSKIRRGESHRHLLAGVAA